MRTILVNPIPARKCKKKNPKKSVRAGGLGSIMALKKDIAKIKGIKLPKEVEKVAKKHKKGKSHKKHKKISYKKAGKKKISHKKKHVKKHVTKRKKISHVKKHKKTSYFKISGGKIKRAKVKKMPKGSIINPIIMGNPIVRVSNPKKRKGVRKMKRFKNPLKDLKGSVKEVMNTVPNTLFAGAGYLGTNIVTNLIPISVIKTNTMIRVPVKVVLAVGLSIVANMVNKKAGEYVMLGSLLNVVQDVVDNTAIGTIVPLLKTGASTAALPASNATSTTESTGDMLISENEASTIFGEGSGDTGMGY